MKKNKLNNITTITNNEKIVINNDTKINDELFFNINIYNLLYNTETDMNYNYFSASAKNTKKLIEIDNNYQLQIIRKKTKIIINVFSCMLPILKIIHDNNIYMKLKKITVYNQ